MANFVAIPDVPIFCSIADIDPDGNPIVYDEKRLRKMVDYNNGLIECGERPTWIVGHNEPNKPARSIGFIESLRLGTRDDVPTVFANAKIYDCEQDAWSQYPKTSAELTFKGDAISISAVAILGHNPALNLGDRPGIDADYDRQQRQRIKFHGGLTTGVYFSAADVNTEKENNAMNLTPELEEVVLSVLNKTDIFKFYKELMDKEVEYVDESEKKDDMSMEKSDEVEKADEKLDPPAETMNMDKEEEMEDKKEKVESKDGEMDEKSAKYSAVEKENRELKFELRNIKREKTLMALANEGYQVDIETELADSADLTDTNFDKHVVEKIKKYSGRSPIGVGVPKNLQTKKPTSQPTESDLMAIIGYQRQKNISYDEALSAFLGGQLN